MHPDDQEKTAFITDMRVYCYNMMSLGLKDAGATYQGMMNKVFAEQIGRILEVYIDDMIFKTPQHKDPMADLEETFDILRRYDLRLNPNKCTFSVETGKFLGFMLTNRGIEVNLDKYSAILNMQSPRTIKEVQQLTGRIAALTRFLLASAKRCLPFFKTLRRKKNFEWNVDCEQAFKS